MKETKLNAKCSSQFGNDSPGLASRVILWDCQPERRGDIGQLVHSAGARVVDLTHVRRAKASPACPVAVVRADAEFDNHGMQVIRGLSQRGFKIIACADGANSWRVKLRCLPLLAGAVQLLDSAAAGFHRQLREALLELLRVEAKNYQEATRTKSTMRSMGMVGESAAMMRVFRATIRFSALSDLPVLITGETGTGKEGLARSLHRLDPKRSAGPFVAVNCGAIAPSLAESEFFGHRRGAFTGADHERKGLIRSAQGGVLFLDEIGELDASLQAKLLRVLQENRVLGVGEDCEVAVDVRIVAATNRDLHQMGQQSRFRADLFHRLNVLSIQVPPLRERPDDLAPLTAHFLEKYRSLGTGMSPGVHPDFLEALRQVDLPGNVRQLENLVRQALVRKGSDSLLGLQDLPVEMLEQLSAAKPDPLQAAHMAKNGGDPDTMDEYVGRLIESDGWNLSRLLERCECHVLNAAMRHTSGNQSQAARLLGITPRSVYNKVHKHRLER